MYLDFMMHSKKLLRPGDKQMEGNSQGSQKTGGGIFLFILSLTAFVIVPVFLCLSLMFGLLTCPQFYTRILKNADLIETYIEAANLHLENKIKREIEGKVHLQDFRDKYESVKSDFENREKLFNELNRTEEYIKLVKQHEELDDLSWDRAPDKFKTENDFEEYKKKELERLEIGIDEIKLQRDIRKNEIEKAEKEMENARDIMEDEKDVLEDKIDEANDIIASYKESFMGDVYSDVAKISPVLTEELNSRLIDRAVRNEAEKIIRFFSSYYEQKELGNVYTDRLDNYLTGQDGSIKVKLPAVNISLWVEDEINGIVQKRHLLSEIFVERINEIKNLKNPKMFIKLFSFADSGTAELIGESYLKDYNIYITNGAFTSGPVLLEGRSAESAEWIMIAVTWGKYVKYVLTVIAVVLLLYLILAAKKRNVGYWNIRWILVLPSLIIIIAAVMVYFFSGQLFSVFPDLVKSPVMQLYCKSILDVAIMHLLAPVAGLFALLLVAGLVFFRGKGEDAE